MKVGVLCKKEYNLEKYFYETRYSLHVINLRNSEENTWIRSGKNNTDEKNYLSL